jgi:hypothetical protein
MIALRSRDLLSLRDVLPAIGPNGTSPSSHRGEDPVDGQSHIVPGESPLVARQVQGGDTPDLPSLAQEGDEVAQVRGLIAVASGTQRAREDLLHADTAGRDRRVH